MRKAGKRQKKSLGNENFLFEIVSKKDYLDLIKKLPPNKAIVSNNIPVSVLKEYFSAYSEKLTDIFNNCIITGTFPELLKKAEATLVSKKSWFTSKSGSRPVNAP